MYLIIFKEMNNPQYYSHTQSIDQEEDSTTLKYALGVGNAIELKLQPNSIFLTECKKKFPNSR